MAIFAASIASLTAAAQRAAARTAMAGGWSPRPAMRRTARAATAAAQQGGGAYAVLMGRLA